MLEAITVPVTYSIDSTDVSISSGAVGGVTMDMTAGRGASTWSIRTAGSDATIPTSLLLLPLRGVMKMGAEKGVEIVYSILIVRPPFATTISVEAPSANTVQLVGVGLVLLQAVMTLIPPPPPNRKGVVIRTDIAVVIL